MQSFTAGVISLQLHTSQWNPQNDTKTSLLYSYAPVLYPESESSDPRTLRHWNTNEAKHNSMRHMPTELESPFKANWTQITRAQKLKHQYQINATTPLTPDANQPINDGQVPNTRMPLSTFPNPSRMLHEEVIKTIGPLVVLCIRPITLGLIVLSQPPIVFTRLEHSRDVLVWRKRFLRTSKLWTEGLVFLSCLGVFFWASQSRALWTLYQKSLHCLG